MQPIPRSPAVPLEPIPASPAIEDLATYFALKQPTPFYTCLAPEVVARINAVAVSRMPFMTQEEWDNIGKYLREEDFLNQEEVRRVIRRHLFKNVYANEICLPKKVIK